jgi:hypothetical protein
MTVVTSLPVRDLVPGVWIGHRLVITVAHIAHY